MIWALNFSANDSNLNEDAKFVTKHTSLFEYSWFLIRGIVDKEITNLKNIHYLSPSNKLKINDVDLNKEIDKLHDKSKKYKLTKESSIIYTNKLLTNNKENNWIDYLQKSKKKDDLCDCYLQGIYFINSKN